MKTKTVIPKHVAEWIERCKENELTITQALYRSPKFFEDMDNAKKLIKDYENAIALLSRVVERGGAR